jgi:hypothetical protein
MQSIEDSAGINESNIIPVVSTFNDSSEIHYRSFEYWADGAINKQNQRLVYTRRYLRQSGLSLSESGTRYLTVSAGIVWYGIKRYMISEYTTSTGNKFYQWYHDPSDPTAWIVVKDSSSYNNTHYDDISLGYTELTAGKYGVNWIYLMIADDEIEIMYTMGRYEYASEADAQASTVPTAPTSIDSHCLLLGRVIFLKGAASGTIETAFDTYFSGSQVSDHSSLTNIQGGQAGEYYHLKKSQYDILTDGSNADSLHIHNSKIDKVVTALENNFATFDSSGNIKDSGKSTSDYASSSHNHDSRYYQESEVDSLLANKADIIHSHTKSQITDFTETNYVHTTGNETISGNKTFTGNQQVEGIIIRPWSNLTLSLTNNDIIIGSYKNFRIIGPTGNFTITGIQGGVDGREIVLYNPLSYRMVIANESTSSTAENRILTLTGGNVQTTGEGVFQLIYDGVRSRWIVIGNIL